MTPAQRFTQIANEKSCQGLITFDQAWSEAARENPDLHTIMRVSDTRAVQLYNRKNRASRRAEIANVVERRQKVKDLVDAAMDAGLDYDTAWAKVQRENPMLWNEMVSPAASETDGNTAVPAVATAEHFALFRMPINSTQDEFAVAAMANGGVMSPVNPGKIFDGLVQYWLAQRGGNDYEAMLAFCKQRYPDLWRDVETLAKTV